MKLQFHLRDLNHTVAAVCRSDSAHVCYSQHKNTEFVLLLCCSFICKSHVTLFQVLTLRMKQILLPDCFRQVLTQVSND
jgi:hypothetical protein